MLIQNQRYNLDDIVRDFVNVAVFFSDLISKSQKKSSYSNCKKKCHNKMKSNKCMS